MRRASIAALLFMGMAGMAQATGDGPARTGPTVLHPERSLLPFRGTIEPAQGQSVSLIIEGLDFAAPPRVMYRVSLVGPDGRRAPVGVIDFFTQGSAGYGAGEGDGAGRRMLDATVALQSLGGRASAVEFKAISGVTGPGVARANPDARVSVESVRLEAR